MSAVAHAVAHIVQMRLQEKRAREQQAAAQQPVPVRPQARPSNLATARTALGLSGPVAFGLAAGAVGSAILQARRENKSLGDIVSNGGYAAANFAAGGALDTYAERRARGDGVVTAGGRAAATFLDTRLLGGAGQKLKDLTIGRDGETPTSTPGAGGGGLKGRAGVLAGANAFATAVGKDQAKPAGGGPGDWSNVAANAQIAGGAALGAGGTYLAAKGIQMASRGLRSAPGGLGMIALAGGLVAAGGQLLGRGYDAKHKTGLAAAAELSIKGHHFDKAEQRRTEEHQAKIAPPPQAASADKAQAKPQTGGKGGSTKAAGGAEKPASAQRGGADKASGRQAQPASRQSFTLADGKPSTEQHTDKEIAAYMRRRGQAL